MYLHEAPKASDATALAVKVQNSRLVKSVRRTFSETRDSSSDRCGANVRLACSTFSGETCYVRRECTVNLWGQLLK